jgi:rhodanese-related sulfurtransferase
MMNEKLKLALIIILIIIVPAAGCSRQAGRESYQTISSEEAKSMIDEMEDAVILDVRTREEFEQGHIEKAVLIPYTDIEDKIESIVPDKETTLLVYCRSGRRSAIAAGKLAEMGYVKVYDFGGIIDWPYGTVNQE